MFQYADYIYEIYKTGSFTAAARNLFISQPALSATVKKVEQALNVQLFDRQTSPLSLTPEGEAYVRAIEELYRTRRNFENYLADVAAVRVGSVSVSSAMFTSSFVLPKIITKFAGTRPHVRVDVTESNSKELEALLINEKTDLLLDYHFDDSTTIKLPLLQEQVLLAVPADFSVNDPLHDFVLTAEDIRTDRHLDSPTVSPKLFENEPFVLLKNGNDMRTRADVLCQEHGFAPRAVMLLDQLLTSYNVAHSGMGVAFVTDTLVKAVPATDRLCFYKVGGDAAKRTLYIAHKKNRYLNRAVQSFIETAISVYA